MAGDFDPTETLNFLTQKPLENWLDYYVDKNKLSQLVLTNARETQKELLVTLLDQFAEQALIAQREHEVVLNKNDPEDVVYSKKKLARIWMNAATCFAAVYWDIDSVFEKLNVNQMTGMMSYLIYEGFPDRTDNVFVFDYILEVDIHELTGHKLFLAWIFVLWILRIDRQCRFQQPMAKATVSNPLAQVDPGLVQAERFIEMSRNLQKYMPQAMNLLNRLITSNQSADIAVPDVPCFLNPMKDVLPEADLLMPGETMVDNEPIMKPDFTMGNFIIDAKQFLLRSIFETLRAHMSVGHYKKSTELCHQLIGLQTTNMDCSPAKRMKTDDPYTRPGALMWLDPEEFRGYCEANDVAPVKPSDQPIALQKHSEETVKALGEMTSIDSLAVELHMGASSSELQIKFATEIIVASLRKGDPVDLPLLLFVCADQTAPAVLGAVLLREIQKPRQQNLKTMIAFIYFVCGISSKFAAVIEKAKDTCSLIKYRPPTEVRQSFDPKQAPPREKPVPTRKEIAALQKSDFLIWKVLTTFDFPELKELVASDKKFHTPQPYKMPDMLYESIMNSQALAATGTSTELISIYMGKLEQLAGMSIEEWEKKINEFATELGPIVKDKIVVSRMVYEAVRVKIEFYNKTLHRQGYQLAVDNTIAALVKAGTVDPPPPLQKFMTSICAFTINMGQWDVLTKMMDASKFRTPTFDMARVLASCLAARHPPAPTGGTPPPVNAALVTATGAEWWKFMMPTFQKLGRNETTNIGMKQMESFVDSVKEPRALTFLIDFFGKLYNHAMMKRLEENKEEAALTDPAGLKRIFLEHYDAFPQSVTVPISERGAEGVEGLLDKLFENAMLTDSTNGFWLRSYGDYKFAKQSYREAMILYIEVLIAISDPRSLFQAFPENVVDDAMWMKMIKSCQHLDYPTLAALLTQMMKDPGTNYPYAHKLLMETLVCKDAGAVYFPLIADPVLAEFMSDAYFATGQKPKVEMLARAMSDQALNHNNHPLVISREASRRRVRFLKVLTSHFFDLHDLLAL